MAENLSTVPVECIAFGPGWEAPLSAFLADLDAAGESPLFHPHDRDEATLARIPADVRADVYILLVQGRQVLGYGLLRGWDAGFAVPSLGIAVHPSVRGSGFGRALMEYLEAVARHRGADAVRLRVAVHNDHARGMYERRGYRMAPDATDARLLVGLKPLREAP